MGFVASVFQPSTLRLDLLARRRVDHVVVVGGDLLVQALGRMRQQVPVLVQGTALHRHAIPHGGDRGLKPGRAVDNEEFGTAQPTADEIVEHSTPGFGALAAHTLDREQHFLTIRTHADDDQQRDGGRLAVEPYPHHGAVEDQSHDRFFGQRAGIQRCSRTSRTLADRFKTIWLLASALNPEVADLAPYDPAFTAHDEEHGITYMHMLNSFQLRPSTLSAIYIATIPGSARSMKWP